MTGPAVSVLMPTFNRGRFLGEAIPSVLGQTFADLELLVVDDGSTDGTAEVVAGFRDPRLRYLPRPHQGLGATLNAGVEASRGRYLARLDSDDLWLPDLLETLVPLLEADPGVGLAYARGQGMDEGGRPLPGMIWGIPPTWPRDPLAAMLTGDCTCNITVVARREAVLEAGLYDPGLTSSEDWDLWLRVCRRWGMAFADRVLARFRRHGGNHPPDLETRVGVLERALAWPGLSARHRALAPSCYRNLYTGAALTHLDLGRVREALGALALAFRRGGNPLATAGHVALQFLSRQVLSRTAWGRRLVARAAAARHRWRGGPGSSGRGSNPSRLRERPWEGS